MPTNSPHPLTGSAPGILDLQASLLTTPAGAHTAVCINTPPMPLFLLAARLGELYEIVFPEQPAWQDESIAHWHDEEAATRAVETFLDRVAARFPVHTEIWDYDLEAIEWPLYQIPILPLGYNIWHDGWDDLKEPAPYLLHMTWSREQDGRLSGQDEFRQLYPEHPVPRFLEPHRLTDILRQIWAERYQHMEPPYPELQGLPALILMLNSSADNLWLDMGDIEMAEGGGYLMWSRENVALLTQEWQAAQPVFDSIHRLLDWSNETPAEVAAKVTAVRDLLLEAYERSQEDESTTPTATATAP